MPGCKLLEKAFGIEEYKTAENANLVLRELKENKVLFERWNDMILWNLN